MPISESLQPIMEKLTATLSVGFDIAMGVMVLWGLFLWLTGARIIRFSIAIGGAAAGAGIGWMLTSGSDGQMLLVGLIGGAVIGGVGVWLTHRLWTALLLATVLAGVAPWAVLAWKGGPPPAMTQSRQTAEQIGDEMTNPLAFSENNDSSESSDGVTNTTESTTDNGQSWRDRLMEAGRQVIEDLKRWWDEELGGAMRWSLTVAAAIMGITGLIMGLAMPKLSTALVATVAGSLMIYFPALLLGQRYVPSAADYLPQSPRSTLMLIVALIIVGTLIQWITMRKSADK